MSEAKRILNELEEQPDSPQDIFKVLHDAFLRGNFMWTPHLQKGPYTGEALVVVQFRDGTETVVDSILAAERLIMENT